MTQETKNNILKYLTGNITEETPSSNLPYSNIMQTTNNLSSQLQTALGDFTIIDIIQGKDNDGNGLENSVIYGNYNNNARGFVAIINENGELLQIITKYTSGINIGQIYTMNNDENGYFYMVEYGIEGARKRFILLNNIVLKASGDTNYSVNIRRAYAIPNTTALYNANSITKLTKAVGQAKYIIAGTTTATHNDITYIVPLATQLTINVGAENEWVDYIGEIYNISGDYDSINTDLDIYATWNGDTLNLILMAYPLTTPRYVIKYINSNNSLNFTPIIYYTTGYVNLWGANIKIINPTKAYFSISGRLSGYTTYDVFLYEINLTNNLSSQLYHNIGSYDSSDLDNELIKLIRLNNELYFLEITPDTISLEYQINVGKIRQDIQYYQDEISLINIDTLENAPDLLVLNINKQFNLYYYNVLIDNINYNFNQIYNSNNYNGTSIEGIKSIIPNSGQIFDENGNIIFARNLYNKIIANNITTSTIQVPNNFINNINIKNKDLLSYNNNILVDDNTIITTNIYETLNINYINTINITDRNNPNYPINRNYAANQFNNSINNTLDYSNKKATKIRYFYHDNTTEDFVLTWNLINNENNLYRTIITVSVEKQIDEMQIRSADGNITYAALNTSSMEIGKDYSITTDVHIV